MWVNIKLWLIVYEILKLVIDKMKKKKRFVLYVYVWMYVKYEWVRRKYKIVIVVYGKLFELVLIFSFLFL